MGKLRKKSALVFSFLFFFMIVLTACSNNEHQTDSSNEATVEMMVETEEHAFAGIADRSVEDGGLTKELVDDESRVMDANDRMVIYHANVSLEVNDFHRTEAEIQKRVNELGGFVIESSIYRSGDEHINGNLVVKVPQAQLQSFLNEVESNSVKVHERFIAGNDVTEEYVDLESRMRSKRVVEKRLLGFMEEATNTEDLLKISADLAKVQEELEQIQGRMNYLENHVEFSTVTIHLQENKVNVPTIGSDNLNTWEKSKRLFMETINQTIALFSSVVVIMIGLSPLLLPLGVIALLIVLKLRKKGKDTETL